MHKGDVSVVDSKVGYSRRYQIAIDENRCIAVQIKTSTGELMAVENQAFFYPVSGDWTMTRLVPAPTITPEYEGDIPAITTIAGGAQ